MKYAQALYNMTVFNVNLPKQVDTSSKSIFSKLTFLTMVC